MPDITDIGPIQETRTTIKHIYLDLIRNNMRQLVCNSFLLLVEVRVEFEEVAFDYILTNTNFPNKYQRIFLFPEYSTSNENRHVSLTDRSSRIIEMLQRSLEIDARTTRKYQFPFERSVASALRRVFHLLFSIHELSPPSCQGFSMRRKIRIATRFSAGSRVWCTHRSVFSARCVTFPLDVSYHDVSSTRPCNPVAQFTRPRAPFYSCAPFVSMLGAVNPRSGAENQENDFSENTSGNEIEILPSKFKKLKFYHFKENGRSLMLRKWNFSSSLIPGIQEARHVPAFRHTLSTSEESLRQRWIQRPLTSFATLETYYRPAELCADSCENLQRSVELVFLC